MNLCPCGFNLDIFFVNAIIILVKANKKGIFILDTLDLQAYGGKKLKITAYLPYDDQINGEYGLVKLRTVKFAVH